MNSSKFSELQEKYYKGETSLEEERLLKQYPELLQEPLPLTAFNTIEPVMDWSFEAFLLQADVQPEKEKEKRIFPMHWMKYAAAIVIVTSGIALYILNDGKRQQQLFLVNQPEVNVKPGLVKEIKPVEKILTAKENNTAKSNPVKRKKYTVPAKQSPVQQKNDDFFVMVNGRRITDENEALAILQQSLDNMSGDVKETLAGINNFPKPDLKFK